MCASPSTRRVVITGLGLISPLGNTPAALWNALCEGRSGVGRLEAMPSTVVTAFGAEARPWSGEIDDFGPLEGEKKKAIRKGLKVMCRESQMGVAAAQRALTDAGLGANGHVPERTGVVFGSDYMLSPPDELAAGVVGCLDESHKFHFNRWAEQGMPRMQPLWLLKFLPNMPASHITFYNDFRGPSNSLTDREASGNLSVGEALHVIQRGAADMMVAGATGTRLQPIKAVHALQTESVAQVDAANPAAASRPFDKHRTGAVLGEGAAAVVLESLESAQARGAKIYGEVIGAGSAAAADRKLTPRRDVSLAGALRQALRQARLTPEQIGHIQAHGLATPVGDAEEAAALAAVLGDRVRNVPVTAVKSYIGNLGAGSGMVELIAGVLALGEGKLFPVLNYSTPDPQCAVRIVTDHATPAGETMVNLSVTPQGQASCAIVRRWNG